MFNNRRRSLDIRYVLSPPGATTLFEGFSKSLDVAKTIGHFVGAKGGTKPSDPSGLLGVTAPSRLIFFNHAIHLLHISIFWLRQYIGQVSCLPSCFRSIFKILSTYFTAKGCRNDHRTSGTIFVSRPSIMSRSFAAPREERGE